jgi:hypothetical protein
MSRGLLGKRIPLLVGGLWLLWLGGLARQLSFAAGGPTEGGFPALLNLYGYIHVTAWGLGWSAMRRLNLALTALETTILSYLLGLGILSSAIALAGFFGWLTASAVFVILAFAGLPAALSAPEAVANLRNVFRASRFFSPTDLYERSLFVLVALTVPVMLAHTLTPVWDYDALLYHLEAPRRFLAHGGIYFDQEMMRSAYPYLGEMLFAAGMMFHLDVLSKLIHLTYAVLFVLGVYAMGVRFFNRQTALIAAGILVSVPSFILWSTWASIDFAWAGYELWSVYAITRWLTDERQPSRRWLMLAGVMSGFAAGTKYISVPPLLILAALLAWFSRRGLQQSTGETLRALLVFSLSAALAGGGWYLKNLILTGNPVYPLVFGGAGWEPLERKVFNAYMQTFGMGKTPLHLLLLPYNVYAHQDRFSTMPQELIHPLLWLAFLFPFCAKCNKHSFLIIYTMTYFAWWFLGSQVIRFLLPITGFLALFAGAVLEKFPKWAGNALKFSLISGLMIVSLVYHTLTLRNAGAFEYMGGRLSSDSFLRVVVDDYHVKQYIQASLSPAERALFLWDGRGYYCDNRCIADTEQALAVGLAFNSPPPASLARELREKGVTHLMLSLSDANFFVALHDPQGLHRRALEYYQTIFLPACGKSVFKDAGMELFQIDC